MAAIRSISHCIPKKLLCSEIFTKKYGNNLSKYVQYLSYASIPYSAKPDPRPLFFNKEVQSLLRFLTRVDMQKVFKKRKLGEKLEDPVYKFMTNDQLKAAIREAHKKADELLQIPPVVPAALPVTKILSEDPALQGLETSKFVFVDITFGTKDYDRLITVRDVDGTLKEADMETRHRVTQIYFPKPGRNIKPPRVFQDQYFENLLNRKEYEFLLDLACMQYDPYDPEYQRIVSITYQHLNDNNGFEKLRSTRHFGSLSFFLTWNKNIDNLLLELIETCYIDEANQLLNLYSRIHNITFEKDGDLKTIEDYIKKVANKQGVLELALQAYKDVSKKREELESGIRKAHGFN